MDEERDSLRRTRRNIDEAAKLCFAAGLRAGLGREAAAEAAGFTSAAFFGARRRDKMFGLACTYAYEMAAAEEREAFRAARLAESVSANPIEPNNGRPLQRQRHKRQVAARFDHARKQLFLNYFAGTADVEAACDAAGVAGPTVYKHRQTDPQFREGWDEALSHAYALLDAEALRQRMEAQRRAKFELVPTGELALEFERVIKLLERWDKRAGRIAAPPVATGRQKRWTFEESIELLDRRLRALGVRHGVVPPGGEEEGGEG